MHSRSICGLGQSGKPFTLLISFGLTAHTVGRLDYWCMFAIPFILLEGIQIQEERTVNHDRDFFDFMFYIPLLFLCLFSYFCTLIEKKTGLLL